MSALAFEALLPEQITVVSGIDEGVEIDLRCAAWSVLECGGLSIAQILIDNRTAPGATGSSPLPGAEDELRTSLPFQITGYCDPDGVAHPTARIGLRRNWVFLTQHLFRPSATGPLSATYQSEDPDEAPIDFLIQFATPDMPTRAVTDWTCNLPVVLPHGALVPEATGS